MQQFKNPIGFPHYHFDHLDSTNTEAKRMIDQGRAAHGMVVSCSFQSAGKGQFDRVWQSSQDQNLMTSLIISPQFLHPEDQFFLNILASLSVLEVVRQHTNNEVFVKWPNDVYVKNRKISGILIQNFIQARSIRYSIVGIGLNVNQKAWENSVPNATSLILENEKEAIQIADVFGKLMQSFNTNFEQLAKDRSMLRNDYTNNLLNVNRESQFIDDNGSFSGIIKGIDKVGRLLVERDGTMTAYDHGEIKQDIH